MQMKISQTRGQQARKEAENKLMMKLCQMCSGPYPGKIRMVQMNP